MYSKKILKTLVLTSFVFGGFVSAPNFLQTHNFFPVLSVAHAEIKTYTGIGEYVMSDFETPDIAKQRAKQYAERNAQEQAGVYVNSYTKVENFKVTEDEIITMTNGILSVNDVKYEVVPLVEYGGIVYRATIQASIDTSKVDEWISKGANERSELVEKNRELQKAIDEQDKQIAELKKQIENIKTDKEEENLKAQFEEADKVFLSNEKVKEGNEQFIWDNDRALSLYNEAIELNPQNGVAYFNRGLVYIEFQDYSAAAEDFDKAVSLNINSAILYNNFGYALTELGKYNRAETCLKKSVEMDPNYSYSYNNLGYLYIKLKKFNIALDYLKKAESMNTASDKIYANLGKAYFGLQDYENALYNLDNSIELNANIPETLRLRAKCYRILGSYNLAEVDEERATALENGTAEILAVG